MYHRSGYRWVKKKLRQGQFELKTWIYLISVGIITAMFGWLLDGLYKIMKWGRELFLDLDFFPAYAFSIVWGITFTIVAIMCCKKLSVYAKGSGTPEIKTILAGTMLLGPLSTRCLIAKLLGLVAG